MSPASHDEIQQYAAGEIIDEAAMERIAQAIDDDPKAATIYEETLDQLAPSPAASEALGGYLLKCQQC